MTNAYHLRAPGQKGIHVSAWGSFLGQLLLRTMDRGRELYESMLLRGYHEHFHYAPSKPFGAKDAIYLAVCLGCFALLRFVPVAALLGRLLAPAAAQALRDELAKLLADDRDSAAAVQAAGRALSGEDWREKLIEALRPSPMEQKEEA